jgi:hypothetical protein
MQCSQCGAAIVDGSMFCGQCGRPVEAGTTPVGGVRSVDPSEAGVQPTPVENPPSAAPIPVAPRYRHTDDKAVASFLFGILSLILSIFTGIPAIVLGHIARANIRKSGGQLKGNGLAAVGLASGYLSLGFFFLMVFGILIPNLTRMRVEANEHEALRTLRRVTVAQFSYQSKYGGNYAPSLTALGPAVKDCDVRPSADRACLLDQQEATLGSTVCTTGRWCNRGSYRFSVAPASSSTADFIVSATPLTSDLGRYSYCMTASGMIHARQGEPVARPLTSVAECESWKEL